MVLICILKEKFKFQGIVVWRPIEMGFRAVLIIVLGCGWARVKQEGNSPRFYTSGAIKDEPRRKARTLAGAQNDVFSLT